VFFQKVDSSSKNEIIKSPLTEDCFGLFLLGFEYFYDESSPGKRSRHRAQNGDRTAYPLWGEAACPYRDHAIGPLHQEHLSAARHRGGAEPDASESQPVGPAAAEANCAGCDCGDADRVQQLCAQRTAGRAVRP